MSSAPNQYGVTQSGLERYAKAFNDSEILETFDTRLSFPDTETVRAVIDEPSAGLRSGQNSLPSAFAG